MTKQEQIEEMAVLGCVRNPQAHTAEECAKCDFKQGQCNAYRHAEALYNAGYGNISEYKTEREMLGSQIKVLKKRLNNKYVAIERLKAENEQLKVKLEKNPLAIKQKIMEEDDYELTEREQATLFLDRMESDVEILHDIVENLDELLGKGINEYIMGIDGVEGIKDMWERSAVMAFAGKVKEYINDNADFVYKSECGEYAEINITLCEKYINELLKEYE